MGTDSLDQATTEQTLDREQLHELAQQLRVDSVRAAAAAGSGHPTSSMSAADLMAVLMSRHLRYDFAAPDNRANDHLVFSKGHASPLLYSMYKLAGAITDEELLTFREFGSRLQGHPTPEIPWVDVATGSLGQGLPISIGMALAGDRLEHADFTVWVLCGDSELAEGSMWEAFEHAGNESLSNLVAIVDVNRLGQRGPTMHEWDTGPWAARAAANGWDVQEIDGHDLDQIDAAYATALASTKPAAIFARTKKGSGVAAVEDKEGWHGKPLEDPEAAVAELGGERSLRIEVSPPEGAAPAYEIAKEAVERPSYEVGEKVATRGAYGDALAWLGSIDERVVALDGEVGNSTYAERFGDKHPDRFFEMYIAEQQMIAAAVGMQTRGWKPFASSFGAFLSRAYDFIRMAAFSEADLKLCGSHVGISIGPDGPSQMALEDIASLRAVLGSVVLYPSDPNQTVALLDAMREHRGISYMRTTRGALPTLYEPGESFEIGGSRTLVSSGDDAVALIGAGITLHECLAAADELSEQGIAARVIDLYSVKPVDAEAILQAAADTRAIVTVEDHWPEGGIGETVAGVLAAAGSATPLKRLAVEIRPSSGPTDALLAAAGIDAAGIVSAATSALG
jgi:transketolase